jgi:hypothetical protein
MLVETNIWTGGVPSFAQAASAERVGSHATSGHTTSALASRTRRSRRSHQVTLLIAYLSQLYATPLLREGTQWHWEYAVQPRGTCLRESGDSELEHSKLEKEPAAGKRFRLQVRPRSSG